MTSEAGTRPLAADERAEPVDGAPEAEPVDGQRDEQIDDEQIDDEQIDDEQIDAAEPVEAERPRRRGARLSLPLVPVLAVLLVLLLAAGSFLWSTRPQASGVSTSDYVAVLTAARSEIVDLTSFDYLTLDDDIAQARKVTTGDLQKESVAQLQQQRQQLTQAEAVVNTEVVGAAVTHADGSRGTVLLVIQSTQKTANDAQPQVVRYRIQAELEKVDGRWLLSGITGR